MSVAKLPGRHSSRWKALSALLLGLASGVALGQAPQEVEAMMKKMLLATQENSYDDFVAQGDPALKAGMTKQLLEGVSLQIGPRLKQGYSSAFLGKLKQQGFSVYLWKLEFKDGKDDLLVTMSVKDGKVGGFWLR